MSYETTEEFAINTNIQTLYENIEANMKAFAPKVLEELNSLTDEDYNSLMRTNVIMLRQWFEENTEETL